MYTCFVEVITYKSTITGRKTYIINSAVHKTSRYDEHADAEEWRQ
jgi:hypothetical protein